MFGEAVKLKEDYAPALLGLALVAGEQFEGEAVKNAEKALKKSGGDAKKLWEESHGLQKHLQHLTHQILSAQEDKRKKISHDLQDEIAQTLLGINVLLLSLKTEATTNARALKRQIASTQRVVDTSVKTIKRFAREFGKHHET